MIDGRNIHLDAGHAGRTGHAPDKRTLPPSCPPRDESPSPFVHVYAPFGGHGVVDRVMHVRIRPLVCLGGGASPKTSSPPPQTKVTIWSGHFWYTKFWVQNPLPPSPPLLKRSPGRAYTTKKVGLCSRMA